MCSHAVSLTLQASFISKKRRWQQSREFCLFAEAVTGADGRCTCSGHCHWSGDSNEHTRVLLHVMLQIQYPNYGFFFLFGGFICYAMGKKKQKRHVKHVSRHYHEESRFGFRNFRWSMMGWMHDITEKWKYRHVSEHNHFFWENGRTCEKGENSKITSHALKQWWRTKYWYKDNSHETVNQDR